ncbi:MAG: gfo/Idh/MocA family oxidoreductase, partial [Spirochaetia bacterium]
DAARYVIGADSETVYCHEWNPPGSWYRHGASAVAVFRMARGIAYTYQGSWCAEGVNTSWEADWHIICENGSLRWNGGNEIRAEGVTKTGGFASETEEVSVPVPEMDDDATGHGGVIADFVAALQSGGEPLTVCTDNIKSLAMVHGAIESAESGRQLPVRASGAR